MKVTRNFMIGAFLSALLFLTSCGSGDTSEIETPVPTATVELAATTVPQKAETSKTVALPTANGEAAQVSPLDIPIDSPLALPIDSPLAAPNVNNSVEEYRVQSIPTPATGKANLIGRVIARYGDSTTYMPVMMTGIYLSGIIRDENGQPVVASLDNKTDPSAGTDAEGYFHFTDVPPGQYVLMVFSGLTFYVIRDEDGKQMFITVQENEMKDLGLIKTTLPPEQIVTTIVKTTK